MASARKLRVALAAAAIAGLATSVPAAITVTRTTTFNPGILWADFTYSWTITVAPGKGPYDNYQVTHPNPLWLANLNTGSYSGPGAIAGAQPATGINVRTLAPGGFVPPTSGSIKSVSNPKFVAGRLTFQILLGGVPVNAAVTASLPQTSPNATTVPGSMMVAFNAGTFTPNSPIDLFQATSLAGLDARIGFGTTTASGAAMISLNRPLLDPATSELAIGIDGQLISSIPTPGTAALLLLGLFAVRRRRA